MQCFKHPLWSLTLSYLWGRDNEPTDAAPTEKKRSLSGNCKWNSWHIMTVFLRTKRKREQVGFCQHFITRNGFIASLTTLLLMQSCLPTLESAVSSLKASYTCLSWTPPPRSRKLAGFPPWRSMMSQVAIANPAPFTAERHKGQRCALKCINISILKTQFVTIEHKQNKKGLKISLDGFEGYQERTKKDN